MIKTEHWSKGKLVDEGEKTITGIDTGENVMLDIPAFQIHGDNAFFGAISGQRLPDDFEGYCIVYFDNDKPMIFRTGIENGERYWTAIGNNPKIEHRFV